MGELKEHRLSPKQAVDTAFAHFKEFYSGDHLDHLLLEGIRYDDTKDLWEVTIGFDIGRMNKVAGQYFFEDKREPIREFRIVKLKADDGAFLELSRL